MIKYVLGINYLNEKYLLKSVDEIIGTLKFFFSFYLSS